MSKMKETELAVFLERYERNYHYLDCNEKIGFRKNLGNIFSDLDKTDPYRSVYEYGAGSIVESKVEEFVDKFLLCDDKLKVKYARNCGVTSMFVSMIKWVVLNDYLKATKEIWFVCPDGKILSEVKNKITKAFSGVYYNLQMMVKGDEIRFKNGSSVFLINALKPYSFIRKSNPEIVFIDGFADMEKRSKLLDRIYAMFPCKTIYSEVPENDENNTVVINYEFSLSTMNIQWFHDLDRCSGLKLSKEISGTKAVIKPETFDDIMEIIGNGSFIYELLYDGWIIESDVVPSRKNNAENIEEDKDKSLSEIALCVSECVADICERTGVDETKKILDLFNNCTTIKETMSLYHTLEGLTGKKADKDAEDYMKSENYINFLKDIFAKF